MTVISEIAPDTYRISIYVRERDLQFNHMLIMDDEPLLFATGTRAMFPTLREAVATVIDPARLRWIGFGHFEGDECGALNEWLELAPSAQPVCGFLGARLNIDDFALRPARMLVPDEVLATGQYRYRFCPTPHLPHGWDSGMLFEERERTLLCSDLFFHYGNVEPLTEGVSLANSTSRITPPYQYRLAVSQMVVGSCSRWASVGCREPFLTWRTFLPTVSRRGRLVQRGIQPQSCYDRHRLRQAQAGGQQLNRGITAIGNHHQ